MKSNLTILFFALAFFCTSCTKEIIEPCKTDISIYNHSKFAKLLFIDGVEDVILFDSGPYNFTTNKIKLKICFENYFVDTIQKCFDINNRNCTSNVFIIE